MHNESAAAKKQRIRTEVRRSRRDLAPRQVRQRSEAAGRLVARTGAFHRADKLAFYLPNDGELDPRPLMERARALHKRCYLPVIDTMLGERLAFAPCQPDTPLRPNRFGIPEPQVPRRSWETPRMLDVIYAPLVAFTPEGHRLGMGGGFYDRTLEKRRHFKAWRRPRVFGLAMELQKRDWLPTEEWDVAIDGIATEARLYPDLGGFR
ncbi:5-formyltetrahydrofolate cyclo-ligase [Thiohalorhabdus sp.]|uniref:5-formyltetrahydrofolate cyclo-ligase n=1 Tax=Thiohalorhabdus sp. TaxID=3094134 RepID=UPI002FC36E54